MKESQDVITSHVSKESLKIRKSNANEGAKTRRHIDDGNGFLIEQFKCVVEEALTPLKASMIPGHIIKRGPGRVSDCTETASLSKDSYVTPSRHTSKLRPPSSTKHLSKRFAK